MSRDLWGYGWRMGMPVGDAYDLDYRDQPPDQTPTRPGPWYHASPHDLPEGTILDAAHPNKNWFYRDQYAPRNNWVWMHRDPQKTVAWGTRVYEVEPLDEGPHAYNANPDTEGFVSPRARILHRVKRDQSGIWKPYHTASRLAMPAWYHNTHNPNFKPNPMHEPANVADEDDPTYGRPGLFITQHPDEWPEDGEGEPYGYRVEFDGPEDMSSVPGAVDISSSYDRSFWVPADQYHHLLQKQITRNKKAKYMTAAVTVYTKPSCPQCDMTKKVLDRLGIEHQTVDVTADPEAHAYVTGLGYQQAPVVVVGDGERHWGGFRPDHLKGLVE